MDFTCLSIGNLDITLFKQFQHIVVTLKIMVSFYEFLISIAVHMFWNQFPEIILSKIRKCDF